MYYRDFLRAVHEQLAPPSYLEVGIRDGASLALSSTRSIAIDPDFRITQELHCDVALYRTTSDEFFARPDALAHFRGEPTSLSLIDGMHLFEFALRDFINIEKGSAWHTVTFLDDMFPRHVEEAARDRVSINWTGDVYKVGLSIAAHRPDLRLIPVNTRPTGLMLVLNQDAANSTLGDRLDEIIAEFAADDPQPVPRSVLDRDGAVHPEALLGSGLFPLLRRARDENVDADTGRRELAAFLDEQLPGMLVDWNTTELPRPPLAPWPPPKPKRRPPPPPPPPLSRRVRWRLRRMVVKARARKTSG